MVFTVARSSAPLKPPLLSKEHAVHLWYANQRLQQTSRAAIQSKERHKASAATATRRCAELECRLSVIERRATDAEARVEQLRQALATFENQTAPKRLRLKLLGLTKRFHPERTATTTPTEITKALNALVEEMDG